MKERISFVLCVAIGLLLAGVGHAHAQGCEQHSPTIFVIEGRIDAELALCVSERLQPETQEVVLNSEGGDVGAALAIAEQFEGRDLTIRIREQCNSSCANYLVPTASRLILEPGALMLLHGGIDPAFVAQLEGRRDAIVTEHRADGATAQEADRRYQDALHQAQQNAERQRAFAERNGIRLGWLIHREAEEPNTTHYLSGASEPSLSGNRFILVEEQLILSCLPRVQVASFQEDLQEHWLGRRFRRLRERQIVRSGTLHCDEPSPAAPL